MSEPKLDHFSTANGNADQETRSLTIICPNALNLAQYDKYYSNQPRFHFNRWTKFKHHLLCGVAAIFFIVFQKQPMYVPIF